MTAEDRPKPPVRRCLQRVQLLTGGVPLRDKVASICADLDVIDVSDAARVPGSARVEVLLAGNDRDLHLAAARLKKLGGSLAP